MEFLKIGFIFSVGGMFVLLGSILLLVILFHFFSGKKKILKINTEENKEKKKELKKTLRDVNKYIIDDKNKKKIKIDDEIKLFKNFLEKSYEELGEVFGIKKMNLEKIEIQNRLKEMMKQIDEKIYLFYLEEKKSYENSNKDYVYNIFLELLKNKINFYKNYIDEFNKIEKEKTLINNSIKDGNFSFLLEYKFEYFNDLISKYKIIFELSEFLKNSLNCYDLFSN